MRFCFMALFLLFGATTVRAEGLPANPWLSKNIASSANNGYVQNDNTQIFSAEDVQNVSTQTSAADHKLQYDFKQEMQNLQDIAANLKAKSEQADNSSNNVRENNDNVSTSDALKAFGTLSEYLKQKKDDANNGRNNGNSDDFGGIKRKFSDMMNQGKTKTSSQNSFTNQKINKAKYEYNRYKSQFQYNYNSLKNKTKPLYDTMKKSVQEAEKATGVKF